jgi:hypothetical protein
MPLPYTAQGANPLGDGLQSPAGSITDPELQSIVQGYKRTVASGYRALIPGEIERFIPTTKLLVSPKIDGEMWCMVCEDGDAILVNPRGRVISGDVPVLNEARKTVAARCQGRTILAGELWAASKVGRPRSRGVAAALGGGASAQTKRLAFSPFDLVRGGDDQARSPLEIYEERLEVMRRLTEGGKRIRAITTEVCSSAADVQRLFEEWVDSGKSEGLVVRPIDGRTYKIKPAIFVDAVLIGYTGRAEDPEQVRSTILALMREDGQFQIIGSLGNLGDEANRKSLMQLLRPLATESTYRHASSDGALYRFVKPQVVVEFRISDVQSEDTTGLAVHRMVLEHTDTGWKSARKMPGVSIISPVFQRLREDKTVNATDIRMEQVLDRTLVAEVETRAEAVSLPESTLIAREVYAKEAKGKTAVRKLVAWRTNKDELDPRYAPYVIHYTDYSFGRKAPLQHTVRLAPDLSSCRTTFEELKVAKKVTSRGWSLLEEHSTPMPD